MPNPIELLDRSNEIKHKIQLITQNIKNDILSGAITNKTQAFIRLRDEVTMFIKSLVGPTMTLRPAFKFPVSKDINDMFSEAWNDIHGIYNSINNTNNILDISFKKVSIERDMLTSMNKYINKRVSEIEADVNDIFTTMRYKSFAESFINHDTIDTNMITGTIATIDTVSGTLSLNRTNALSYNNPDLTITNNSNGFPGDTHQATASGDSIQFSGELDSHIDLTTIGDGQKDTWFEYEAIKVDDIDYKKTSGYGFEYKEGIRWLSENDNLILELVLTFVTEHAMNYLFIDPFLPIENAYIPAKAISIIINDGHGLQNQLINKPIELRHEEIFFFPIQTVKTITIKFQQDHYYRTMIGHMYYRDIELNHNLLEPTPIEGARCDGDKPSVETLGIKFEPSLGTSRQPSKDASYIVPNSKPLFNKPIGDTNKIAGCELLNGYRYQIGIRSIETACIEFATTSEYISTPFVFDNEVNRIKLLVSDHIPENFDTSEDWIKYQITGDNGYTWIDVVPDRINTEGVIIPGNDIPTINDTTEIRVRILLKRPQIDKIYRYQSPIVYDFTVKGRLS